MMKSQKFWLIFFISLWQPGRNENLLFTLRKSVQTFRSRSLSILLSEIFQETKCDLKIATSESSIISEDLNTFSEWANTNFLNTEVILVNALDQKLNKARNPSLDLTKDQKPYQDRNPSTSCRIFLMWKLSANAILSKFGNSGVLKGTTKVVIVPQVMENASNTLETLSLKSKINNVYAISKEPRDFTYEVLTVCLYCYEGRNGIKTVNYWSRSRGFSRSPTLPLSFPGSFNEATLKVSNIVKLPYFFVQGNYSNGTNTYGGHEYKILKMMAGILDFRFTFVKPPDGQWGAFRNGKWTGHVKMILDGKADLAAGAIGINYKRARVVDFSFSYEVGGFTFVTNKPNPLPRWLSIIWPFPWTLWLLLVITTLVVGVLYLVLRHIPRLSLKHEIRNPFLTIIVILANQNLILLPQRSSIQLYLAVWWVFCFIVTHSYKAALTSYLTVPAYEKPIDTVHDLQMSTLTWLAVKGTNMANVFNSNPVLLERRGFASSLGGYQMVYDHTAQYAFVSRRPHITNVVARFYTNKYGDHPFHTAKQDIQRYLTVWLFPKHCVFKERFDMTIMRLFEAGLINKWEEDVHEEARTISRRRSARSTNTLSSSSQTTVVLSLLSVSGAYFSSGVGLGLALISFFLEYFITHRLH